MVNSVLVQHTKVAVVFVSTDWLQQNIITVVLNPTWKDFYAGWRSCCLSKSSITSFICRSASQPAAAITETLQSDTSVAGWEHRILPFSASFTQTVNLVWPLAHSTSVSRRWSQRIIWKYYQMSVHGLLWHVEDQRENEPSTFFQDRETLLAAHIMTASLQTQLPAVLVRLGRERFHSQPQRIFYDTDHSLESSVACIQEHQSSYIIIVSLLTLWCFIIYRCEWIWVANQQQ